MGGDRGLVEIGHFGADLAKTYNSTELATRKVQKGQIYPKRLIVPNWRPGRCKMGILT